MNCASLRADQGPARCSLTTFLCDTLHSVDDRLIEAIPSVGDPLSFFGSDGEGKPRPRHCRDLSAVLAMRAKTQRKALELALDSFAGRRAPPTTADEVRASGLVVWRVRSERLPQCEKDADHPVDLRSDCMGLRCLLSAYHTAEPTMGHIEQARKHWRNTFSVER